MTDHGERISYIAGYTWRALDETAFIRIHKHLRGVQPPPPKRFKAQKKPATSHPKRREALRKG